MCFPLNAPPSGRSRDHQSVRGDGRAAQPGPGSVMDWSASVSGPMFRYSLHGHSCYSLFPIKAGETDTPEPVCRRPPAGGLLGSRLVCTPSFWQLSSASRLDHRSLVPESSLVLLNDAIIQQAIDYVFSLHLFKHLLSFLIQDLPHERWPTGSSLIWIKIFTLSVALRLFSILVLVFLIVRFYSEGFGLYSTLTLNPPVKSENIHL